MRRIPRIPVSANNALTAAMSRPIGGRSASVDLEDEEAVALNSGGGNSDEDEAAGLESEASRVRRTVAAALDDDDDDDDDVGSDDDDGSADRSSRRQSHGREGGGASAIASSAALSHTDEVGVLHDALRSLEDELQRKDRDLRLSAQLGQMLMEKNEELTARV